MSGNEIVIVSIKPALTNHLDVVTPLSDIYVYMYIVVYISYIYRQVHTLYLCYYYIKDNTTYMYVYTYLTNSNSNGPIRIKFQFAELAVWECIVHPSLYYNNYYTHNYYYVQLHCSHWRLLLHVSLTAHMGGPISPGSCSPPHSRSLNQHTMIICS